MIIFKMDLLYVSISILFTSVYADFYYMRLIKNIFLDLQTRPKVAVFFELKWSTMLFLEYYVGVGLSLIDIQFEILNYFGNNKIYNLAVPLNDFSPANLKDLKSEPINVNQQQEDKSNQEKLNNEKQEDKSNQEKLNNEKQEDKSNQEKLNNEKQKKTNWFSLCRRN